MVICNFIGNPLSDPLSDKGITDEITDNHPIDICSVGLTQCYLLQRKTY